MATRESATAIPHELIETIISHLDTNQEDDRETLRSCSSVSWIFHELARRRLFHKIEFLATRAQHLLEMESKLRLLMGLLSDNSPCPGLISCVKYISIRITFRELIRHRALKRVQMSIADVLDRLLDANPTAITWIDFVNIGFSAEWKAIGGSLQNAIQKFLLSPSISHLELRKFSRIPRDLFQGAHLTSLVINDTSPTALGEELTAYNPLPRLVSIETDGTYPLHSIFGSCDSSLKFLEDMKLKILSSEGIRDCSTVLHRAIALEKLDLSFMLPNYDEISLWSTRINTSIRSFQRLTHLALNYWERDADYSATIPASISQLCNLFQGLSLPIASLALTFAFVNCPYTVGISEMGCYQREHWRALDQAFVSGAYPDLQSFKVVLICGFTEPSLAAHEAHKEVAKSCIESFLANISSHQAFELTLAEV